MERNYKGYHENNRRFFDEGRRGYRQERNGIDYSNDFESRYQEEPNRWAYEPPHRYRNQDYEMERNYHNNEGSGQQSMRNMRQEYEIPQFNSASHGHSPLHDMEREPRDQRKQGYGSGRMSGYSGSAFGGANYSSHGGFGGADRYGAMSGYGGNAANYVSSSGYGGGGNGPHPERGFDYPNTDAPYFERRRPQKWR
ncbi:hypothetical protein [uncultured Pontibacter sp.]|uniref:hypothetical protein n=1 Tax=uncultured Pontibacter sp. TaxID=453356 RepID=UPI0026156016|nr:hypothetical protein [uncultured Pontibacter sp.]